MSRLTIDSAVIEITRRCNMKCDHCLRGEAQHLNIPRRHIDTFMERVECIGELTLTGGEPSLAVRQMRWVLESMQQHNVSLGNFYVVTNGKEVSKDFVLAVMEFWAYCDDGEVNGILVSGDQYHEWIDQNAPGYRLMKQLNPDVRGNINYLIAEGRAEGWGDRIQVPDTFIVEDGRIQDGTVYLNARGKIIAGRDFSYKSQRKPANIVCDVTELCEVAFLRFSERQEEAA